MIMIPAFPSSPVRMNQYDWLCHPISHPYIQRLHQPKDSLSKKTTKSPKNISKRKPKYNLSKLFASGSTNTHICIQIQFFSLRFSFFPSTYLSSQFSLDLILQQKQEKMSFFRSCDFLLGKNKDFFFSSGIFLLPYPNRCPHLS